MSTTKPIIPADPITEPCYTDSLIDLADSLIGVIIETNSSENVEKQQPAPWKAGVVLIHSEDRDLRRLGAVLALRALLCSLDTVGDAIDVLQEKLSAGIPVNWGKKQDD